MSTGRRVLTTPVAFVGVRDSILTGSSGGVLLGAAGDCPGDITGVRRRSAAALARYEIHGQRPDRTPKEYLRDKLRVRMEVVLSEFDHTIGMAGAALSDAIFGCGRSRL